MSLLPRGRERAGVPLSKRDRSEAVLVHLGQRTGLDRAAAAEDAGDATGAKRWRRWAARDRNQLLAVLELLPTISARISRREAVDGCGQAYVARRGLKIGWHRRGCRDRFCPDCSAQRSRVVAAEIRAWIDSLPPERRERLRFLTLTRPKTAWERPEVAVGAILRHFKEFTRRPRRKGDATPPLAGGVRGLEVTSRSYGEIVGRHMVKVPGIHAHLHLVCELAEGVDDADVLARWIELVPGTKLAAQDIQRIAATAESVHEVCKYPVDMSGLEECVSGSPSYVAAVLSSLHGRRLLASWGTWRGGPDLTGQTPGGSATPLEFGDATLRTVLDLVRTAGHEEVVVTTWRDGTELRAKEVLAALRAGDAELVIDHETISVES